MTSSPRVSPLLTVKQVIPPVRAGALPRARLEKRLEAAATGVTVVVAPAGWGKTSLLCSWASSQGDRQPVAWLSLDESDDEPCRFWSYVISSLRRVSDEISPAALDALGASGVGPLDLAVPILLNELADASVPHVVVVDDYHVLTDSRIHESVEFLVSYLPESLRIVMGSRSDPPLPLARMRARGELTELRAADLRFSLDEAAALVSTVSGADLDAATTTALWEHVEGWAAGLQLAGLALRDSPEPNAAAPRIRGDHPHVMDYIASEVLPGLAPGHRELLIRAAPLEHLSGDLCDAALQITGSREALLELDKADLFVVGLDTERTWYRCHHLLREVLLRELEARSDADTGAVLHRAAAWFADHDRIDDAVRHLLRSGDTNAAASLLESTQSWFIGRGSAATYVSLGEALPRASVGPQLAIGMAYAAATSGHLDRVTHWLDICDERIAADTVIKGWSNPRAAAVMMRAVIGTPDADSSLAVLRCQRAVALEADAGGAGQQVALAALGCALARDARFDEAAAVLVDSWRQRDRRFWAPTVTLQIAGLLGLSLLELGRDADLDAFLRKAGPVADEAERIWGEAAGAVVTMVRSVQGRDLYQRGDSADARTRLARAAALAEIGAVPTSFVLALTFLADAELSCGDRSGAREALARAHDVVDDEPVTPFVMRRLHDAETRIGRVAARSATRSGVLAEDLTDRELSILRVLPGSATQREIGDAMFLSVNTVKAYNKSLYRKLGVASRQDAVATGRALGLI